MRIIRRVSRRSVSSLPWRLHSGTVGFPTRVLKSRNRSGCGPSLNGAEVDEVAVEVGFAVRAHWTVLSCVPTWHLGGSAKRASSVQPRLPQVDGLQQSLLLQELLQYLEPHLRVVDLEHALLHGQRQRQELGQAIAHPRGVLIVGL